MTHRKTFPKTVTARHFLTLSFLIALIFLLSPSGAYAQTEPESYSHPELKWKTIETGHFTISYHEGAERTARVAAKIAEEVYGPITSLYNHDPGVVNIIIKDTDDYSNGGAYFFQNKIEIWAPALEFHLRGQHNWLRNVITHEYTHIVTITSSLKYGRLIPAIYLQYFGYEKVRRPDVLYGFPNMLVSYPFAGISVPFWLAEGVAQYQKPELRYDTWDSHRDMILRSLILEDKLFDLDALSNYASKNSIEFEFAYNAGFALTHYLAETYGEEKLKKLCDALSSLTALNAKGALEEVYGKPADSLYNEWKSYLKKDYEARLKTVQANPVSGTVIEKRGFANYNPLFSPDGKKVYYISNLGADFGGHSIVERDVTTDTALSKALTLKENTPVILTEIGGHEHTLGRCKACGYSFDESGGDPVLSGVSSRFSLSNNGRQLFYSKYTGTSFEVQKYNDLFIYDLDKKSETRITFQKRLETPSLSPDNKTFAAVHQTDGTSNLVEGSFSADTSRSRTTLLTHYKNGEQVLTPVYSPDGKNIFFVLGIRNQRRLMAFDRASNAVTPVLDSIVTQNSAISADDRDPALSPDGKILYFASDRTGIFNIYRLNLETKELAQLTNVTGGAFMPSADAAGHLLYATFTSSGYKIASLKNPQPIPSTSAEYFLRDPVLPFSQKTATDVKPLPLALEKSLTYYDDTKLKTYPEKEYETIFDAPLLLPIIRFDTYSQSQGSFLKDAWRSMKLGAAYFSDEALGKLSFGGALAVGPGSGVSGGSSGIAGLLELERDAYISFDYSDASFLPSSILPKISLEVFHQTRNVEKGAKLVAGLDSATANVFYTLTEVDLSLRFRVPVENWFFKASRFKLTGTFSFYNSKVGSFFWQPISSTVSASSEDYFIGRGVSLSWMLNLKKRTIDQAINPVGFFSLIRFDYESDKLQRDIDVANTGVLVPVYQTFNIPRLTADLNFYLPLPGWKHTLTVRSYSAMNLVGKDTDFFFYNFISGLLGMRGYEYYAIGADKATMLHFEYRFPLVEKLNFQFLQFYFDKLYFSTYFDMGTAWSEGNIPAFRDWRRDVGFELRLEAPSYYVFPTRIFLSATYGIDEFRQQLRNKFYTPDGRDFVTYGGKWMVHFGILFDFDLIFDGIGHGMRRMF
ncbi:MAG: hypothetical protein HGB11_00225 [Chlorobiales bacterium]|nr:hypothetical protein [Chlorobiales bacterium]